MLGRLYGMDDLCEYITWKGPFLRTLPYMLHHVV